MEATRTIALLSILAFASAFHSSPSLLKLGSRASLICAGRNAPSSCSANIKMQAVDDKTEVPYVVFVFVLLKSF